MKPKKGATTKHFCEMQGTKENENNDNDKHKELMCDEEKDEDEEHHTMLKDKKLIRSQMRRIIAMV